MVHFDDLRVQRTFPAWSWILPLLVKGLIFPPLARLTLNIYERTKDLKYLRTSIQYSLASLFTTPMNHPSRAFYQSRLAEALYERFLALGSKMDLRLAQLLQQSSVRSVQPEDPFFHWHRRNLRDTLRMRFETWGKIEDLDAEIGLETSTTSLLPFGHKNRAFWFRSLASAYGLRFRALGLPQDANAELDAAKSALDATPERDKYRSWSCKALATAYSDQFDFGRRMEDLETALKWGHSAVSAVADKAFMSTHQQLLSNLYIARYMALEELSDLEKATGAALKCLERPESDMGVYYHSLSRCYILKYERLDRDEDLEESFQWARKAFNTKTNNQTFRGAYAHQLAYISNLQYYRFGHVDKLEEAVRWSETAIDAIGGGADRNPPIYHTYANSLHLRYHRYLNRKDLDLALKYSQLAIDHTPPNNTMIDVRRELLVSLLQARYRLDKNPDDIRKALEIQESVVSATKPTIRRASERYRILAGLHEVFYNRAGGPRHHRDDAMRWNIAALDASPPDDPNRASCLASLIQRYSDRYLRLRNPNDLEEAIKIGEELQSLVPADNPHLATYLSALGDVYAERFNLLREARDRDQALKYFKQVCSMDNADPSVLWTAAQRWISFTKNMSPEELIHAYRAAYRILPELFWLGNDMKSRHETLVRYRLDTFASDAIRSCLGYGALELATEFLEQSLSLTFQQLLDLRTDLSELREKFPNHASLLENVSKELFGVAGSTSVESAEMTDRSGWDKQRKLALERGNLVKNIRELPGFENFLRPVGFDVLNGAADAGPVIILYPGTHACHAIIMLPGGKLVRVLCLVDREDILKKCEQMRVALGRFGIQSRGGDADELDLNEAEEDATEGTTRDRRGVRRQRADPSVSINAVLTWTWTTILSPIFSALANNGITGGRIWWCPTGPFTYLPLHAAGPPNAFIPSYTSTLSALIRARRPALPRVESKLLAIGVTEIQNSSLNKLPKVRVEIDSVVQAVGERRASAIMDEAATLNRVTELLPDATWLHLACHGQQGNAQEPLKSGLLLYDDSKLELETIINTDIPQANFVFLSACETAMGDVLMSGESLHLAGGMIFAGFKAVIGTLWSINDDDGPVVANVVYSHLFGQDREPDVLNTAEALHLAVHDLRAKGVPPHRWVPFIHIGI